MWLKKNRTAKPNKYEDDLEAKERFVLYVALAVFAYIVLSIVVILLNAS